MPCTLFQANKDLGKGRTTTPMAIKIDELKKRRTEYDEEIAHAKKKRT